MVALRHKAFVCILHPCRRPSRLSEVILLVPLNMTSGHFQRRGREKTQRSRRLLLVGNGLFHQRASVPPRALCLPFGGLAQVPSSQPRGSQELLRRARYSASSDWASISFIPTTLCIELRALQEMKIWNVPS